jgi:Helix-turn-helix domain
VSGTVARIGVGTRLVYDGEAAEVVELLDRHVLVRDARQRLVRVSLVSLLADRSGRVRLLGTEQPAGQEPAGRDGLLVAELLGELRDDERAVVADRAGHVREVLSGYQAGAPELAGAGEPRADYGPGTTLTTRYRDKAEELGVSVMTVRRWVKGYQTSGEAGLVDGRTRARSGRLEGVDSRWLETCRVVLAEQVKSSQRNYAVALRHYGIAIRNFTNHDLEGANSQLRSFLENLFVQLAGDHVGYTRDEPVAALQQLRDKGKLLDGEFDLLRGLWKLSQDRGAHQGLTTAEEALFRLQTTTSAARFLLHHLR